MKSLPQLFSGFSDSVTQAIEQALQLGVSLGQSVADIAQSVEQALMQPLYRALTIAGDWMISGFRDGVSDTVQGSGMSGWIWRCNLGSACFPAGTTVQTEDGLKNIEDIQPGEKVLTHTGKYQRVLATSITPRAFLTVTLHTSRGAVSATLDHPFLVEREGKLNWVEASDLRLGDHVFRQLESSSKVSNHDIGNRTVEWSIGQAYDPITSGLKPERFTGVTLFDARSRMPVNTIDLETGVEPGQKEVNGGILTRERMLLPILNTQCLEAEPCTSLRFSFSRIASVAAHRTEETHALLGRADTKLFSTIATALKNGRASALLRAVFVRVPALTEYFSTSLARNQWPEVTFVRRSAHSTIASPLFPGIDLYSLSALSAIDGKGFSRMTACPGAELLHCLSALNAKYLVAMFTRQFYRWMNLRALSSVGMLPLKRAIARLRTKTPTTSLRPGVGNGESFIALNTNLFHKDIITKIGTHFHLIVPVYNLEVEEDHTYVANGFVVHNCACCTDLEGTVHPVDEDMYSHLRCQCQQEFFSGEPTDIQSGSDWFDSQDESVQEDVLGSHAALAAYLDKAVTLSDFMGIGEDEEYGPYRYQRSLKEILGAKGAAKYYG